MGSSGEEDDDEGGSHGGTRVAAPCAPELDPPLRWIVEEELTQSWRPALRWCAGRPEEGRRVWMLGGPPGAVWDEDSGTLRFRPDFTQGGRAYPLTFVLDDGVERRALRASVEVLDTIAPPPPTLRSERSEGGITRWLVEQRTDGFLDSPGLAGRSFEAVVALPEGSPPPGGWPVRVALHGLGTAQPGVAGWREEIRIAPHDPHNTYWWGYGSTWPEAAPHVDDPVPPYTARRVLHLIAWVLEEVEGADPARVYATGSSMGGAGALTLGAEYGRHLAWVRGDLAQTVPRLHRGPRIAQLEGWWGPAGLHAIWERLDLTRRIAEGAFDDLPLFTRHGKADDTIRFSAAVGESPGTGESFYGALQRRRVGHRVVWDRGGHGTPDPVLGPRWWDGGWAPMHDPELALARDRAFVAFSRSEDDDTAGSGPDDGDPAGAFNRHLRWRGSEIEDTVDHFSVPLGLAQDQGLGADARTVADVTLRRAQAFRCRPGEVLTWRHGDRHGVVEADADGVVTVPGLAMELAWTRLELWRGP